MITRLAALACALAALPSLAPSLVQAQSATLTFDRAAYITCREAHAMAPEARGQWRPSSPSTQHVAAAPEFPTAKPAPSSPFSSAAAAALYPDAYLLTVVDRAIVAELPKLPKR